MPRNPAINELMAAEAKGDLWNRCVLDFPVWHMLRLERYRRAYLKEHPGASAVSSQPKGLQRIKAEIDTYQESVSTLRSRLPWQRAERDIWVLSSTGYRRSVDGHSSCIFAEHLRRQVGGRLLFIEFNTARMPAEERDDLILIDRFQIPALLRSRIEAKLKAPLLPTELTEAFAPTSAKRLADRATYGNQMLNLARSWLDRKAPKAVFVLDSYGLFVPFQLAIRERGIPLIELQHGIIHESHPGYILPPFAPDAVPQSLPDHLVVFGEHFGQLLQRESGYWQGRVTVGGHPWLQQAVAEAAPLPAYDKALVLFSQYDPPVRERIRAVAIKLAELLPGRTIAIKPHPREPDCEQFYQDATERGVLLADRSDDSYRILASCALSVTVFSTIAIESLAFGCKAAVLRSEQWSDVIADMVDAGLLMAADGADDLAALMAEGGGGEVERRAANAEHLFGIGAAAPDFEALAGRLAAR